MSEYQPQGYDPRQRPAVTPPQWQGQPGYQQPQPQGYGQPPPYRAPLGYPAQPQYAPPQPKPRKKRRVFLWVFLAIQVIFVIWIIAGVATNPAGPTAAAQAAHQCANGGWQGLFSSQADCQKHYAVALNDAGNVGKGIGVAVIVIAWVLVDFFLGLGYGIYRLASRR